VTADPIPLVSVITNVRMAVVLPGTAATARPVYVPVTVPVLPSAARNDRVNVPACRENVVTTRAGATTAVAFETVRELLAGGTGASALGATGPAHPERANASAIEINK
jgi:hypothetical protein